VLLALFSASFLVLAWISFTAGLDLWRLRERGRLLASFSTILFLPLGFVYRLILGIWWTPLGVAICTFSLFFFRIPASTLDPTEIFIITPRVASLKFSVAPDK
jgi:uncharacterized membrane protein (DUF2068 family)